MRRWGDIIMWTGGCLALLAIVRGVLESAPPNRLSKPPAVAVEFGLQPPVVAIGYPVADFAPLQEASAPSPVDTAQSAVGVPREDGLWRLPPPYQGSAASPNDHAATPLVVDAQYDAQADSPPRSSLPQVANRALSNSAVRLPSIEVETPPEVRISSGESPPIPSFSVDARIPEIHAPATQDAPHLTRSEALTESPVSVSPEMQLASPSIVRDDSADKAPASTEQGPPFAGELPALEVSLPHKSPPDDSRQNVSMSGEALPEAEPLSGPSSPELSPYLNGSSVDAKARIPVSLAERIQAIVDHGFGLGERGAYFSAREDFLEAIRLVAQSLDAEAGGQRHTQALASGMRALTEAEDFQVAGERLDADFNAIDLSRGHKTPVLRGSDAQHLAPMEAMQRYYAFAEEQLAIAGGEEAVASRAWYALAKLQPFLAQGESMSMAPAPRALVLHRVALRVSNQNYLAQNELGVLLARYGRYQDACRILEQATQVHPLPATWQNLAVVYRELGLAERSEHADQQAQQLAATSVQSTGPPIRLVDVERFRSAPTTQELHSEVARTPSSDSKNIPAQR